MKFNLRDLFLVVLIAALALGWWLDHQRLVKPSVPVPAPPPVVATEAGRWQIVIGSDGKEVLVDTVTGRTWNYSSYEWNYRAAPKQ